jgi:hypothetical protein
MFNCLVPHWLRVNATLYHTPAAITPDLFIQIIYPDDSMQLFALLQQDESTDTVSALCSAPTIVTRSTATQNVLKDHDDSRVMTFATARVSLHATSLRPWSGIAFVLHTTTHANLY